MPEPTETTGQQTPPPSSPAPKSGKGKSDTWIKLGFVVVLLVAGVLIYMHQLKGPSLDWDTGRNREDIDFILDQARRNKRIAVIFFHRSTPSQAAKDMVKKSLTHQQVTDKISELGALTLQVEVAGEAQEKLIEQFDVSDLPAILIYDKTGKLFANKSGFVGHASLTPMLVEAGKGS